MSTIKLNGKNFPIKKIDFAALGALEELGVTIAVLKEPQKYYFKMITALVAFTEDITRDEATKEIELHLENGGAFTDFQPLIESIGDSDFFQKMARRAEMNEQPTTGQK